MRQHVIALAVAMGLLLGAGGIAVLALSDDDPDVLDVATGGGDAAPAAAGEADAAMAPFGAGRVYRYAGPVPDLPDEARAYHLAGEVTEDRVAALAGALGVEGPVQSFGDGAEGTFAVTSGAALLTVPRMAAFPWSFDAGQEGCKVTVSDAGTGIECSASATGIATAVDPDAPVSSDSGTATPTATTTCAPDGSCPEPAPQPVPVPCPPAMPPRPADLPTKDEAERIALDLFRRTGLDPAASRVAVHDGYSGWSVEATLLVDGRPVEGLAWTAFVGGGGRIASAGGYLSLPEEGDVYPLVTVDEAIERLNEGGFAPWGMPVPMATVFREGAVGDGPSVMTTSCAVPPSGAGPTEPAPQPDCPPEAGCTMPPSPPADPGCPPDVACSRGSAVGSVGSAPPPCPPEADCVVPPPGRPEPAPGPGPDPEPVVVELTAVRLGYVFGPSSEPGEMILIPAYLFETGDEFGFPVAVAAVADRFLPSAPQPYPVPLEDGGPKGKPEPAAREPGG